METTTTTTDRPFSVDNFRTRGAYIRGGEPAVALASVSRTAAATTTTATGGSGSNQILLGLLARQPDLLGHPMVSEQRASPSHPQFTGAAVSSSGTAAASAAFRVPPDLNRAMRDSLMSLRRAAEDEKKKKRQHHHEAGTKVAASSSLQPEDDNDDEGEGVAAADAQHHHHLVSSIVRLSSLSDARRRVEFGALPRLVQPGVGRSIRDDWAWAFPSHQQIPNDCRTEIGTVILDDRNKSATAAKSNHSSNKSSNASPLSSSSSSSSSSLPAGAKALAYEMFCASFFCVTSPTTTTTTTTAATTSSTAAAAAASASPIAPALPYPASCLPPARGAKENNPAFISSFISVPSPTGPDAKKETDKLLIKAGGDAQAAATAAATAAIMAGAGSAGSSAAAAAAMVSSLSMGSACNYSSTTSLNMSNTSSYALLVNSGTAATQAAKEHCLHRPERRLCTEQILKCDRMVHFLAYFCLAVQAGMVPEWFCMSELLAEARRMLAVEQKNSNNQQQLKSNNAKVPLMTVAASLRAASIIAAAGEAREDLLQEDGADNSNYGRSSSSKAGNSSSLSFGNVSDTVRYIHSRVIEGSRLGMFHTSNVNLSGTDATLSSSPANNNNTTSTSSNIKSSMFLHPRDRDTALNATRTGLFYPSSYLMSNSIFSSMSPSVQEIRHGLQQMQGLAGGGGGVLTGPHQFSNAVRHPGCAELLAGPVASIERHMFLLQDRPPGVWPVASDNENTLALAATPLIPLPPPGAVTPAAAAAAVASSFAVTSSSSSSAAASTAASKTAAGTAPSSSFSSSSGTKSKADKLLQQQQERAAAAVAATQSLVATLLDIFAGRIVGAASWPLEPPPIRATLAIRNALQHRWMVAMNYEMPGEQTMDAAASAAYDKVNPNNKDNGTGLYYSRPLSSATKSLIKTYALTPNPCLIALTFDSNWEAIHTLLCEAASPQVSASVTQAAHAAMHMFVTAYEALSRDSATDVVMREALLIRLLVVLSSHIRTELSATAAGAAAFSRVTLAGLLSGVVKWRCAHHCALWYSIFLTALPRLDAAMREMQRLFARCGLSSCSAVAAAAFAPAVILFLSPLSVAETAHLLPSSNNNNNNNNNSASSVAPPAPEAAPHVGLFDSIPFFQHNVESDAFSCSLDILFQHLGKWHSAVKTVRETLGKKAVAAKFGFVAADGSSVSNGANKDEKSSTKTAVIAFSNKSNNTESDNNNNNNNNNNTDAKNNQQQLIVYPHRNSFFFSRTDLYVQQLLSLYFAGARYDPTHVRRCDFNSDTTDLTGACARRWHTSGTKRSRNPHPDKYFTHRIANTAAAGTAAGRVPCSLDPALVSYLEQPPPPLLDHWFSTWTGPSYTGTANPIFDLFTARERKHKVNIMDRDPLVPGKKYSMRSAHLAHAYRGREFEEVAPQDVDRHNNVVRPPNWNEALLASAAQESSLVVDQCALGKIGGGGFGSLLERTLLQSLHSVQSNKHPINVQPSLFYLEALMLAVRGDVEIAIGLVDEAIRIARPVPMTFVVLRAMLASRCVDYFGLLGRRGHTLGGAMTEGDKEEQQELAEEKENDEREKAAAALAPAAAAPVAATAASRHMINHEIFADKPPIQGASSVTTTFSRFATRLQKKDPLNFALLCRARQTHSDLVFVSRAAPELIDGSAYLTNLMRESAQILLAGFSSSSLPSVPASSYHWAKLPVLTVMPRLPIFVEEAYDKHENAAAELTRWLRQEVRVGRELNADLGDDKHYYLGAVLCDAFLLALYDQNEHTPVIAPRWGALHYFLRTAATIGLLMPNLHRPLKTAMHGSPGATYAPSEDVLEACGVGKGSSGGSQKPCAPPPETDDITHEIAGNDFYCTTLRGRPKFPYDVAYGLPRSWMAPYARCVGQAHMCTPAGIAGRWCMLPMEKEQEGEESRKQPQTKSVEELHAAVAAQHVTGRAAVLRFLRRLAAVILEREVESAMEIKTRQLCRLVVERAARGEKSAAPKLRDDYDDDIVNNNNKNNNNNDQNAAAVPSSTEPSQNNNNYSRGRDKRRRLQETDPKTKQNRKQEEKQRAIVEETRRKLKEERAELRRRRKELNEAADALARAQLLQQKSGGGAGAAATTSSSTSSGVNDNNNRRKKNTNDEAFDDDGEWNNSDGNKQRCSVEQEDEDPDAHVQTLMPQIEAHLIKNAINDAKKSKLWAGIKAAEHRGKRSTNTTATAAAGSSAAEARGDEDHDSGSDDTNSDSELDASDKEEEEEEEGGGGVPKRPWWQQGLYFDTEAFAQAMAIARDKLPFEFERDTKVWIETFCLQYPLLTHEKACVVIASVAYAIRSMWIPHVPLGARRAVLVQLASAIPFRCLHHLRIFLHAAVLEPVDLFLVQSFVQMQTVVGSYGELEMNEPSEEFTTVMLAAARCNRNLDRFAAMKFEKIRRTIRSEFVSSAHADEESEDAAARKQRQKKLPVEMEFEIGVVDDALLDNFQSSNNFADSKTGFATSVSLIRGHPASHKFVRDFLENPDLYCLGDKINSAEVIKIIGDVGAGIFTG